MEIMKETPWSRIRGQNSVDKALFEIIGNGKPTGSVWKETIAVSATISISVQNRHSRTLLQDLQRSRVWKIHREPEVLEAEAQVGKCLDGPARITSKELAITHFVKSGTLENACFARPRAVADLGKKCSYAHRQVDEQPSKRFNKNDDKSAVAHVEKYDLHDGTWQPVINRDEGHDRSEQPVVKRDTRHELNHGPVRVQIIANTRQLGCVFQDMESPKLSPILRESSDMQKPIQRVKFTKAIARHTKIRDQKSFARIYLPRWTSSAQPQRSKISGSVSKRDGMVRARCPRSSVEAGQKCVKIKGAWKSNILLTFGKLGACLHQL